MFDIGFTELIMIGVVALIVIGPERLPKVARTAGHLFGRMQRYVSDVKADISREMEFDELRRTGQEFKASLEETAADVKQQATAVDDYLRDEASGLKDAVVGDAELSASGLEPAPGETLAESIPTQTSLPLDEPDQNATAVTAAKNNPPAGNDAGNPA